MKAVKEIEASLVWPVLQQSPVSVPVLSGASLAVASAGSSCPAAVSFPGRLSAVCQPSWQAAGGLWPLQSGPALELLGYLSCHS